jgi:release factor glutamine methyltransferase
MAAWTILNLLNWITDYLTEKNIDSPRLSAELLLSHILNLQRIDLYTHFDNKVAKEKLDLLHRAVKRAAQAEPIAYITGKTEFYSIELDITADCLIPRPETELLVDRSIDFLKTRPQPVQVCDLGTGCGCIAIAIAKNASNSFLTATDISPAALNVAAKNIQKYSLIGRIRLLCGNLFDPIIPDIGDCKFDLIVCNPPYVSQPEYEQLDKNVKDYEPKIALYAGSDGLDIYRQIAEKVDDFLKPDGALILEIGYRQGEPVRELLEKTNVFAEIRVERDFHNNDRIVIAGNNRNKVRD